MFLFLFTLLFTKTTFSAFAEELASHELIWMSGYTVEKKSIVTEMGIQHNEVILVDENGESQNLSFTELPAVYIRYGLLDSTEVFTSYTSNGITIGLKQSIQPKDEIPFSVQANFGVGKVVKHLDSDIFFSGGFSGELLSKYTHSSMGLMGEGMFLQSQKYLVWFDTSHQIPLFRLKNVQTDLVLQYSHPLFIKNQEVEEILYEQGEALGITYVFYSSLQAGVHIRINSKISVYGLFSTMKTFGTIISSNEDDFMVVPPWAKVKNVFDVKSNNGVNIVVSTKF